MFLTFKKCKTILRNYLKRYPEERLVALLAHAQSGRLAYHSCCCFIGVETADHALRGSTHKDWMDGKTRHYLTALHLEGAKLAESAYGQLATFDDEARRRIIIPMIRAEIRRRDRLAEHHLEKQPESVHA